MGRSVRQSVGKARSTHFVASLCRLHLVELLRRRNREPGFVLSQIGGQGPGLANPNRTLFIAYPRGAAVLSFAACTRDASGKICDWESAIRIGEKRREANRVGLRKE